MYERHRPEQTPLYALIDEHFPRFLERLEAEGISLPRVRALRPVWGPVAMR